ncbi:FkbM family methyltransferase [Pleurocapsa sp. FMAR1]|uniref:FkbM family methyltransferase n=1 Tax=Pleurocapsa sp. FMAR1 TaxID=3040204 RepID=UPI0029C740E2|nr:FkbM family methyltransferase [Pleurocapsa sp. FMAR1]
MQSIKRRYQSFKKKYELVRRKSYEAFGSSKYSRASLNDIDRKLEKYLDYRNGFFIEVGGNDGFNQSNTYYLEKFRDWQGILVEGIPDLYNKCVRERKNSKVFNYALVSADFKESHITMSYAYLMSFVKGALKSNDAETNYLKEWIIGEKKCNKRDVVSYEIKVPTKTLTAILDECNVEEIDFFSLDVEGYELNVLKGLDFKRYKPKYMLIEARFKEEIDEYISDLYVQVDQLSYHDFLYKCKTK